MLCRRCGALRRPRDVSMVCARCGESWRARPPLQPLSSAGPLPSLVMATSPIASLPSSLLAPSEAEVERPPTEPTVPEAPIVELPAATPVSPIHADDDEPAGQRPLFADAPHFRAVGAWARLLA